MRFAPDISPNAVTFLYKDPPNLSATRASQATGNPRRPESTPTEERSPKSMPLDSMSGGKKGPSYGGAAAAPLLRQSVPATEAWQPPPPAPKRSSYGGVAAAPSCAKAFQLWRRGSRPLLRQSVPATEAWQPPPPAQKRSS